MSTIINRGLIGYHLVARGLAEGVVEFLIRLRLAGVGSRSKAEPKKKKYIGVRAVFDILLNVHDLGPLDGSQFIEEAENEQPPRVQAKPLGSLPGPSERISVFAENVSTSRR